MQLSRAALHINGRSADGRMTDLLSAVVVMSCFESARGRRLHTAGAWTRAHSTRGLPNSILQRISLNLAKPSSAEISAEHSRYRQSANDADWQISARRSTCQKNGVERWTLRTWGNARLLHAAENKFKFTCEKQTVLQLAKFFSFCLIIS